MYDGGKIITGLVIFLILITFPIWYNLANSPDQNTIELEKPAFGEHCMKDKEWMRANHMDLLNTWRDEVVREGKRTYHNELDGQKYNKSLSNTCLHCHRSKEKFCDECHNFMGVTPYCWDCHIENPRGI